MLNRDVVVAKFPVVGGLGNGYLVLGIDEKEAVAVSWTQG